METRRGDAAAATQTFGRDQRAPQVPLAAGYKVQFGRLRRKLGNAPTLALMHALFPYGRGADIPQRRVAATPWLRRGYSAESGRDDAAGASMIFRGDGSRRHHGRDVGTRTDRRRRYALVVQTLLSPLVDPPGLLEYEWTPSAAVAVAASGIGAFFVNFSGFLVVGHLGAIAHVLLGQAKSAMTLLVAAVVFGTSYSVSEIVCATGAMSAIVMYSVLR